MDMSKTVQRTVFNSDGTDFSAMRDAEKWCEDNGISVGRMQAGCPRGLLRGDFDIAKWRNLDKWDILQLDGTMKGDMRHGPVVVELK